MRHPYRPRSSPHKLTTFGRDHSDEGATWAPQNLTTDAQMTAWFSNLIPKFDETHLAELLRLYPSPDAIGSPYSNSSFSPQWSRMSAAYGDYAYISAVQDIAVHWSNWEALGAKT